MKFDFLTDLDDYFCEVYANYDRLCVLPGYRTPKMQDTRIDEWGRKTAYTLPANTMRLALQEKKVELLAYLKKGMLDKSFSFTFRPLSLWQRFVNFFSKDAFIKILKWVASKYNATAEEVLNSVVMPEEAKKGILKGKYYPSKNLILSVGLSMRMNYQDVKLLLAAAGYEFDYEEVRDTVIAYLLFKGIYNPVMVKAALDEYSVKNLFLKEE